MSGKCKEADCKRGATFNEEGKKPVFCALHAEDGMVDVRHRRCKHESCSRRPVYNHPGSKTSLFCMQHAEDGMVNVCNRRCKHESCSRRPVYNHPGSKTGLFCMQHAEDGMVNVCNRRCKHESCSRQPVYNHPGSKTGLFCNQHAEDDMVNVRDRGQICKHPGCTKRHSHGYWAEGIASRCAEHKGDLTEASGLVINYKQACKVKGCRSVVNWGPDGEQPTHCTKHGAPKAADGFVAIPKKSRGDKAAASHPRRGARTRTGDGGTAQKARKAQPRRADTFSSEEEDEEEEESDRSDDDEEHEGEDDSEPQPEPVKKRRIIWL